MRKKGPLLALAWYAASPQGRRRISQLRRRLDTPANRQRAREMADKVVAARRPKG